MSFHKDLNVLIANVNFSIYQIIHLLLKTMNTRENTLNGHCFATNQMWDEIAKGCNCQTTSSLKGFGLVITLPKKKCAGFFLPRQIFRLTVFKSFSCSDITWNETFLFLNFTKWSLKKLLKSPASGITCHFSKYYNNWWNSTLCCNWRKLILHVATEQQLFWIFLADFGKFKTFTCTTHAEGIRVENSIAGWFHICWCGPLYNNYKYHRHAQHMHNTSQV